MASQEKISVYNLADLKNTSDDAIPNYLNSLKFTQSHTLTDVRLALGCAALAVAGACFLWDYKLGFESTKYYTAAAVAVYAVLNSALTLWVWGVEKGVVYVGTAPDGEKLSIATATKKYVPVYEVTIQSTPKNSSEPQTVKLSRPFTEWFDGAGRFIAPQFQTMLATSVPAIGKLDPKRVAPAARPAPGASDQKYSAEVLDILAAAATGAEAEAEAAGPTRSVSAKNKKGGKRRKA